MSSTSEFGSRISLLPGEIRGQTKILRCSFSIRMVESCNHPDLQNGIYQKSMIQANFESGCWRPRLLSFWPECGECFAPFRAQNRIRRPKIMQVRHAGSKICPKCDFRVECPRLLTFSECGECFAPICAHVSRRHVHSDVSRFFRKIVPS